MNNGRFKKGHTPWHKGKTIKNWIPNNCLECKQPIINKPYSVSIPQWLNKKYCNFKCWGNHQSKVLKGCISPMKGRKHTLEAKEKDRLAHLKPNGITRLFRKQYYTLKGLERYARLKGAEGKFTLEEWNQLLCKHEYKCVHCGYNGKLTKDHIIPLTKGGSNYITNIQPLCQSCNSSKGNRL